MICFLFSHFDAGDIIAFIALEVAASKWIYDLYINRCYLVRIQFVVILGLAVLKIIEVWERFS